MTYALDTNIIINLLKNRPNVNKCLNDAVGSKIAVVIPPFVHYEILRGFFYKQSPSKEIAYQNMAANCPIGVMSTQILERAAKIYAILRKSGSTIGDADIMIAAFCIENGYTLVTTNTKHFKNVHGLQLADWT